MRFTVTHAHAPSVSFPVGRVELTTKNATDLRDVAAQLGGQVVVVATRNRPQLRPLVHLLEAVESLGQHVKAYSLTGGGNTEDPGVGAVWVDAVAAEDLWNDPPSRGSHPTVTRCDDGATVVLSWPWKPTARPSTGVKLCYSFLIEDPPGWFVAFANPTATS